MKPKIKAIKVILENTEGTYYVTWMPGKRHAKQMNQPSDPVEWFKDLLRQGTSHYPECMGS